jgi:hypothetical protein
MAALRHQLTAAEVGLGSIAPVLVTGELSVVWRELPQWIRATAVPHTAVIQAGASRRVDDSLMAGSVRTAAAGHRQQPLQSRRPLHAARRLLSHRYARLRRIDEPNASHHSNDSHVFGCSLDRLYRSISGPFRSRPGRD